MRLVSGRPAWVALGALWILAGNLADLLLTLWGLQRNMIREANPLMAALLDYDPALASSLKLTVAAAGSLLLLWAYPKSPRMVTFGISTITIGLVFVLYLHVQWLRLG